MAVLLDISNNNKIEPNWLLVKRHGISGVYLKATEGMAYNDLPDKARVGRARKAGLRVGWYHFARPKANNAVGQAEHFCSYVKSAGGVKRRDLRPVLDFEDRGGLTNRQAFQWIVDFNRTVKDELGVWPAFYSYSAFIEGLGLPRPVGAALWLAAYGRNDGKEYPVIAPRPWKKWHAHQFSSNCLVGGCSGRVDLSSAPRLLPLLAYPLLGLV